MDFLDKLRSANILRNAEWDPERKLDLSFFGNELGGECGEAQNIIKKLERERLGIRGSRSTPAALAEELADVLIVVDLIAVRYDIDLAKETMKKFNKTSSANNLNVFLYAHPKGTRER